MAARDVSWELRKLINNFWWFLQHLPIPCPRPSTLAPDWRHWLATKRVCYYPSVTPFPLDPELPRWAGSQPPEGSSDDAFALTSVHLSPDTVWVASLSRCCLHTCDLLIISYTCVQSLQLVWNLRGPPKGSHRFPAHLSTSLFSLLTARLSCSQSTVARTPAGLYLLHNHSQELGIMPWACSCLALLMFPEALHLGILRPFAWEEERGQQRWLMGSSEPEP